MDGATATYESADLLTDLVANINYVIFEKSYFLNEKRNRLETTVNRFVLVENIDKKIKRRVVLLFSTMRTMGLFL